MSLDQGGKMTDQLRETAAAGMADVSGAPVALAGLAYQMGVTPATAARRWVIPEAEAILRELPGVAEAHAAKLVKAWAEFLTMAREVDGE